MAALCRAMSVWSEFGVIADGGPAGALTEPEAPLPFAAVAGKSSLGVRRKRRKIG
ncbi:MAG: hypothetical protein R3C31_11330 [Hyphomonadaceae bacterium]